MFSIVYRGQLYQILFGGQSVSCESSSPYQNPSKFYHAKMRGMSLSSGFSEILIDICIKFHC